MRSLLHAPRTRKRSFAAATLGALALIGSLLVAAPAHALNDTGTGGVFVPSTGRVLDTKSGTGGFSTPMEAGKYRTIQVAGLAGLPDDGSVGAVSLNATVGASTGAGTLFGRPASDVGRTTMLIYNGVSGEYTSNTATLAVGSDGTIQVMTETSARLILDVQGYYTANTDGTAAGGFVPVAKRIVETRSGTGAAKAAIAPGKSIDVQVTGANGVPAGASGAVVNLIALNATASDGYLTLYATGATRPANSLHYAPSENTSLQAQVPLSADGKMTIANSSTTANLIVDLQGYFTAAGQGGAVFTPSYGRAYDSRATGNTALGEQETRSIQIAGTAGVPVMRSGITAVVLTLIVAHGGGDGYADVYADGTTNPGTTAINFNTGEIQTNTITVPLGANGKIALRNAAKATNYVVDVQGWYTNPVTPTISCASPYSNGSTGSPLPSAPIPCSISAPAAAASGQVLGYSIDGLTETVATLSESAGTSIPVTVPAKGGYHEVSVDIRSASDEPVSSALYSFTDGGAWADETLDPAVGDGTHAWTQAPLQVSPHGDAFPDDVQAQYTIRAAGDANSVPVWVSDTSSASDAVSVPSGVLTAGQTYYWSAAVGGSSIGSDTPVSRTVGPWSFVATDTALVPVCANLLKDTADQHGFTVSDDEWAQYCAGDTDYDANNPAASSSTATVQVKAATRSITFTGWVGSAVGAFGMQHKGGVYYNGSKAWKWYHTCDTDDYGYGFTLQLTNCGTHTTAGKSLVSYMTTRVSFLVRGFPASRTMSSHATVTKSGKTSWGNNVGF